MTQPGFGLFLALLWGFLGPGVPGVLAQDSSALVSAFRSRSIPVEDIQRKDSAVIATIRYGSAGNFVPEQLEQNMLDLFAKIAEGFPDSEKIVLSFFINRESISLLELPTEEARAFNRGAVTAQELMAGVRMDVQFPIEEKLSSELRAREEAAENEPLPEPPREKTVSLSSIEKSETATGAPKSAAGSAEWKGGSTPMVSGSAQWPIAILVIVAAADAVLIATILTLRGRKAKSGPKISARLSVLYDDGGRKEYVIRSPRTTLGRAPDNSLIINDHEVSGHHAEIVVSPGDFLLRDLGSANGTLVNGKKVTQSPLYMGDEITLGKTRLTLGG